MRINRFYSGSSPHIDLIVSVPAQLKLDIDDDSGDIFDVIGLINKV